MARQRARRFAVCVAVVGLCVAAWLLRRRANEGPEPVSGLERHGRELAAAAARRGAEPPFRPPTPQQSDQSAAQSVTGSDFASAAANDYRRQARYPPWSRPLEDESDDPIVRDRQVSPNRFPGPEGKDPALVVFADRVSFEAPDSVILYAYLSVAGTPVPAQRIEADVLDARGRQLTRLGYRDDGGGGDAQAHDAIYTAQLTPDTASSGSYLVRVHAVTEDGDDRTATTGFLYSRPTAQLSGRYTDDVVDGNLEVHAEIQVAAEGRFHLEATLYGQDGRPLAWAQNATRLPTGAHWLPLRFYGLVLREKGIDGPYVLRFVALSTTGVMPNAKNRLVENAYRTRAYAAAEFSDRPFNDPNLLEAAERLERNRQAPKLP